ncbi:MAG: helix-turn-helix domain-containing protein [Solirubrobacteraceae bacterium]
MSIIVNSDVLEADLAAGRLCCPGCDRPLSRWGFAREREVRMLDGARRLRPRRARCGCCETTQVLLDACSVPRRRDGAQVIGQALLAKARGDGHRTIAARLGRPPSTVRGWLRAAARRAETLGAAARRWTLALNLGREPARPAGSPLTDAVEAIGSAVRECRLQLGIRAGPWELAVALTGGLLCEAARRDPLGI